MARKSPPSSSRNESRGIPKGPSLAGCLHVYMLTCLQVLGLTPMLARHRGRDSVLHCGGSDWAHADASPHPDGGTLNPAVAGLRCWAVVVVAALWWCALVVLVRERCGLVWWCACVGSLLVGSLLGCPCVVVPSWWSVCLRLLASVVRAPRVCGRGGSTFWGAPLVWCTAGRRVTRPLECETYSVVCLGLRPAGFLVPSCAGATAWCPYSWGAPHPGDHMGYPSECWSW